MLEILIPGRETLCLKHLVLDFNGTLAVDGLIRPGVFKRLEKLSADLTIHVVTADTLGNVAAQLGGTPYERVILGPQAQDRAKKDVVLGLGPLGCVSMGNGRNDVLMLHESALSVGIIQQEGAFAGVLAAADVVCTSILDGLDFLLHPLRLAATLRS